MDHRKFATSADMGIGFSRSLTGDIRMSILVTNGSGYKKAENDPYKKSSLQLVYGETRLDRNGGVNVGAILTTEPYDGGTRVLYGAFGGFSEGNLRIGGEFNRYGDDLDQTEQLISGYATHGVTDALHSFLRYDVYSVDTAEGFSKDTYLIAGVAYSPAKGLTIAPNIRHTKEDGDEDSITYMLNFQFGF